MVAGIQNIKWLNFNMSAVYLPEGDRERSAGKAGKRGEDDGFVYGTLGKES